ncbi:hypothetical protein MCOR27_011635 [Pyricularia oryzae]|uniref:Nascent polypeptide-associated complex subunit alpha-like UBA domain-containing protein n=1 Tax=Pyricularia oryzae (strain 70-15 / ATCC MYA-4617 / FGSC 8958) TaxID=242507 RepID=G4N682_PYRO7|nr:uncharacterized protein MGG_08595 [Pyricularia oryzae 70-15]KAH9427580.1 hypothetical protein MCOR02_011819 [Pyricularia oryzae]EHA49806.1 hypothetical protein MGG_08595 [Pyricularia oryzae 70-15]KAI6253036.1 hypothetical protein MCOR19_010378 [Pyricularia oryzae]KAI6264742.1 hypothetical protein MCOR27_011635 [Pyricularia oryzae]KAI6292239.1 hypothetical protein MCOR29_011695 [Pyricularia oryzae]
MAEHREPPAIVEGATTADVEDEVEQTAKSAEDRKAAAAMAALDARDEDTANKNVDQEAVSKAMSQLKTDSNVKKDVKKAVKVDAADVALLVDQLELAKPKATELLKQHDGNAVTAMRAYIAVQ